MRSLFLLLYAALSVSAIAAPLAVGPTVRDIVEFTRIVQPENEADDALRDQVSPDGLHAFIVTRKANVGNDKNRYDIQLVDLTPARLAAQRSPDPAIVFSVELSDDDGAPSPLLQDVRWFDDRTLLFLAPLDLQGVQLYSLDVFTHKLAQLTHESKLIVSYSAARDLRRVVYAVQVPNPPLHEGAHDVVVGTQSFWGVKFGQHYLRAQTRMYRYFVVDLPSAQKPRPLGDPFIGGNGGPPNVSISPDGRWAMLRRWDADRRDDWARQYPLVDELLKNFTRPREADPLRYFSNPLTYVPSRFTAWRLDDGKEQLVVDAPDDAWRDDRTDRLWQGTGQSVILAGTHLPPTPGGNPSPASHIIEYWPDEMRWVDVATLAGRLGMANSIRNGFVVTDGGKRREFNRQSDGSWREVPDDRSVQRAGLASWTLHTVQGLNLPPDVYASGPSGQQMRLTALNPQFDANAWGAMRPYTWHDAAGRQWDGGLMSSNGEDVRIRRPLLIQTYGFSPTRFYLDGPNLSDFATGGFAGRAFLRDGILVLAMPLGATGVGSLGHGALQVFNEGVRGAVDALVKEGRVDPARVGIIGWSATGERVLNLVTFGDLPIRAATLADGDANTLFSYAITYGALDFTWVRKETLNQSVPFGEQLATWIRNDPSLHTDCIHSALRIETWGPLVLNNWDVYALLRRQYKPVEMIVIPSGTHSPAIPGDRMASLQGNVDWFGFWLAGKTRTVPLLESETSASLASQYSRWKEMEKIKADDALSRCVH